MNEDSDPIRASLFHDWVMGLSHGKQLNFLVNSEPLCESVGAFALHMRERCRVLISFIPLPVVVILRIDKCPFESPMKKPNS